MFNIRKQNRRAFMASSVAAGASASTLGALLASPALRAQAANTPVADRLLFVVAAAGGGSILESFLPVADTECSTPQIAAGLAVQPASQVESPNGSNLRCVRNRGGTVAELPAGNAISQPLFLQRHAADTCVLTVEGTSVNHRVAQKRSLTGAGINRGRTLMEEVALAYGQDQLIPNLNMASDGYLEPGDDPSVPDFARPESVADAKLFPFQTNGIKGVVDTSHTDLIRQARSVRDTLEEASPFGRTFRNAPLRERYLARRQAVQTMEDLDLINALMMVEEDPTYFPLADFGLQSSPAAARVREVFPNLLTDNFEAQGALSFLLARAGVSCALTLSPSFSPNLEGATMVNTPLAFDFSHADHPGTQNVMWSRVLAVVDGLIRLLKEEDVDGNPEKGKMWDRSLIYIATDFGRDKIRPAGSSTWGSGHHLSNGHVMISPLLNGNRVYGGIDVDTCLPYGFDPITGDPAPGTVMREGHIYSAVTQALGISFEGRYAMDAVVRG